MHHPVRIVRKKDETEEALARQQLQHMANAVVDEAHWAKILESAETEEQRAELQRVIGPLLTFRRAAVCTSPDCGSGQPGLWQPVLVVRNSRTFDDPSWVPIELRLCDTCKADADVHDFVSDAIWTQIMANWPSDTLPPMRALTQLTFDRIH